MQLNHPDLSRSQELILLTLQAAPLNLKEIHQRLETIAEQHEFVWKSDTGTERAVRTLGSKHLLKPIKDSTNWRQPVWALTKRGRQWLVANQTYRLAVVHWQDPITQVSS